MSFKSCPKKSADGTDLMQKHPAASLDPDMISLQIGALPSECTVVWYGSNTYRYSLQIAEKSDTESGDFPTVCREFSPTAALPDSSNGATADKLIYSAFVDGLKPDTEYIYRIGNGRKQTKAYRFKTQDFDGGNFSFLAVADAQIGTGPTEADVAAFADTVQKGLDILPDAAFLVSFGDQTESPAIDEYMAFFSPEVLKSVALATLLGNHEIGVNYDNFCKMPNVSGYGISPQVGAGSGDYHFVRGNTLFIALNSNSPDPDEHKRFMSEVIAAYPNVRWKIVIVHHTLFSMYSGHINDMIPFRETMAPIFSDFGIDAVLSAHDHSYSRTYMMEGTVPIIPDSGVPFQVTDPAEGQVLYVSFNSAGNRFLGFADGEYPFCTVRNQEGIPNISAVSVSDTSFTVTTYRTTDMSVVDTFTIHKSTDTAH